MSLKRRFSCFSRLAHVFRFSSFFLGDALCSPFPRSSLSPTGKLAFLARAAAAPLNWIFSISLTSYCARCHSTYGCQRSRGFFPSDLSSRATAATLRSHFFFGHGGFLRPMRVDFFLIRTHIRVRPPCIKVSSRSSGFFYHDNVPGYFRVYLSASSSFPLVLSPTSFLTPVLRTITVQHIAYSRIISHVISRVSSSDTSFSSLSPLLSRL